MSLARPLRRGRNFYHCDGIIVGDILKENVLFHMKSDFCLVIHQRMWKALSGTMGRSSYVSGNGRYMKIQRQSRSFSRNMTIPGKTWYSSCHVESVWIRSWVLWVHKWFEDLVQNDMVYGVKCMVDQKSKIKVTIQNSIRKTAVSQLMSCSCSYFAI